MGKPKTEVGRIVETARKSGVIDAKSAIRLYIANSGSVDDARRKHLWTLISAVARRLAKKTRSAVLSTKKFFKGMPKATREALLADARRHEEELGVCD